MEIKVADVAELVDARDLKSPGATEITHLSDLTRAGNPHEAGGDPAVLSNTPPPLPLAGRPSKTWADVFLPTSINRRKDRCRLLQSAIASWSLCAAVSTKPLRPPSGSANRCPPKAKVTRSNRVGCASFFFILQSDTRARTETPVLPHSSE